MKMDEQISSFKHAVMMAFLKNADIVEAIDADEITEVTKLVYTHIFDYYRVLKPTENVGSYICIEIDQTSRHPRNDLFCTYRLTVWVLCHQNDMYYNTKTNRLDRISELIKVELDNKDGFGFGELKLKTNTGGLINDTYSCRKMIFDTRELTKDLSE